MDAATRQQVRRRALHRCEYCHSPQSAAPFLRFHIEHLRASQHGRDDSLDNLALACPDCNRHKGPNLSSLDPETGELVPLFNPRTDLWDECFDLVGPVIVGLNPIGRATARLLAMNDDVRVEMRTELQAGGDW